jgi:hypothetical protein
MPIVVITRAHVNASPITKGVPHEEVHQGRGHSNLIDARISANFRFDSPR